MLINSELKEELMEFFKKNEFYDLYYYYEPTDVVAELHHESLALILRKRDNNLRKSYHTIIIINQDKYSIEHSRSSSETYDRYDRKFTIKRSYATEDIKELKDMIVKDFYKLEVAVSYYSLMEYL